MRKNVRLCHEYLDEIHRQITVPLMSAVMNVMHKIFAGIKIGKSLASYFDL
jgi:hypothetical protein